MQHADGRYAIRMQARLEVPPAAAYAAFTHYERLPQINPAVRKVMRLGGAPAGVTRLSTEVRVCVSFYCRHFRQVQDLHPVPLRSGHGLRANVLPQHSDLRHGSARWSMLPCNGGTCLEFSAELEPAFWVPPLIGPWLIRRAMREEAIVTAQGIERIARETAG